MPFVVVQVIVESSGLRWLSVSMTCVSSTRSASALVLYFGAGLQRPSEQLSSSETLGHGFDACHMLLGRRGRRALDEWHDQAQIRWDAIWGTEGLYFAGYFTPRVHSA